MSWQLFEDGMKRWAYSCDQVIYAWYSFAPLHKQVYCH